MLDPNWFQTNPKSIQNWGTLVKIQSLIHFVMVIIIFFLGVLKKKLFLNSHRNSKWAFNVRFKFEQNTGFHSGDRRRSRRGRRTRPMLFGSRSRTFCRLEIYFLGRRGGVTNWNELKINPDFLSCLPRIQIRNWELMFWPFHFWSISD